MDKKTCPVCKGQILVDGKVCPYCHPVVPMKDDTTESMQLDIDTLYRMIDKLRAEVREVRRLFIWSQWERAAKALNLEKGPPITRED